MNDESGARVQVPGDAVRVYKRLLAYAKPHWRMFLFGVLGMALFAATNWAWAEFVRRFLNDTFVTRDRSVLWFVPGMIVLLFLLRGIGDYISSYCLGWIGRHVIKAMRAELFGKYLCLPTAYYDRASAAQMLSRLTYNIELVAEAATNSITVLIRDSLTFVGLLGYIFWLNWKLAAFALAIAPLIAFLIGRINRLFRRYSTRIQNSMGDVTRVAKEALEGHRVVKVFGAQEYEQRLFEEVNERNRHSNMRLIGTKAASNPVVQLIAAIGLAGVMYVAVRQAGTGGMLVGDLMSFLTALMLLTQPLRQIVNVVGPLQQGIAAGASVFEVLDEHPEPTGGSRSIERARGDVEFRNVGFVYAADKGPVLRGVSVSVPPGTTLAIVGRSGSGKSTLVNLLPRFYDAQQGTVLLDGHDVREYQLADLRKQVSLVSQDVVLFNGTIRENIAFNMTDVPAQAVEDAARAAYVLEFANELPQGLDTIVGERAALLSGGQRQRISIARALLKNAPVLIMDEAMSALDTDSERRIQAALVELLRNRTTLVIAHRLSTVEQADNIVVLNEGAIVESGTHSELLAHGGLYAQLYRMQFRD